MGLVLLLYWEQAIDGPNQGSVFEVFLGYQDDGIAPDRKTLSSSCVYLQMLYYQMHKKEKEIQRPR